MNSIIITGLFLFNMLTCLRSMRLFSTRNNANACSLYQKHTEPRLYIESFIPGQNKIELSPEHSHYALNVMRLRQGDSLRVFNRVCGEFLATIDINGRKKGASLTLSHHLRSGDASAIEKLPCRLLFAPIKKTRMKMMLEKATELGITDLLPVITKNTQYQLDDPDQYKNVLIQSAEQCERLTIPKLHKSISIAAVGKAQELPGQSRRLLVCAERSDEESTYDSANPKGAPLLKELQQIFHATEKNASPAFDVLVGPEGGFTDEEIATLSTLPNVSLVSLGPSVLRAETAVICALGTVACFQSLQRDN